MSLPCQHDLLSGRESIKLTGTDKVRISRTVAELLKAGLITRHADALDRRREILGLTAAGKEIYQQILPLVQKVEAEIVAALSTSERGMLDNALSKIEAYLDR